MRKYDYECPKCKKVMEIEVVSMTSLESRRVIKKKCPDCKVYMKKLFSKPAIRFKGTGFYSTDKDK